MLVAVRSKMVDAWLVSRAVVALVRIDGALQRTGFWPVVSRLDQLDGAVVASVALRDIRRAQRLGRRISQASAVCSPRFQCLHRSVVLHQWLRRDGLPSELCIGILKDGNDLKAHAWVEIAGQIVNDSESAIRPFVLLLRQGANSPKALPSTLMNASRIQWR